MMWWHDKLVEAVEKAGIELISGARYMDDIRNWCHGIRLGWRMVNGLLMFSSKWREEEKQSGMSLLQKTTEVLRDIMNGVCGWLVLTMETEDMFGGVLPSLDLAIWVREDNKVLFQYYEKPMVPKEDGEHLQDGRVREEGRDCRQVCPEAHQQ